MELVSLRISKHSFDSSMFPGFIKGKSLLSTSSTLTHIGLLFFWIYQNLIITKIYLYLAGKMISVLKPIL